MRFEKIRPLLFPLMASLTLGLAPFIPEPHIWKQLVNVSRGTFTEPIDWFDLLIHGAPWVWLGFSLARLFRTKV